MRNVVFSAKAFEQYQYWQEAGPKILRKLNQLLRECQRPPFLGTGKSEPLKGKLVGFWSRRLSHEHRLVYEVDAEGVFVVSYRYHYQK